MDELKPPAPPGESKKSRKGLFGRVFRHEETPALGLEPAPIVSEPASLKPYGRSSGAPRPTQMTAPPLSKDVQVPPSITPKGADHSPDLDVNMIRESLGLNAGAGGIHEVPEEPAATAKSSQFEGLRPRHAPEPMQDSLDELPDLEPLPDGDEDFTAEPERMTAHEEPLSRTPIEEEFDNRKSLVPEDILRDSAPDYKSIDRPFDRKHEFRNVETPHPPEETDWTAEGEDEDAPPQRSIDFTKDVMNHAEHFEKPSNTDFLKEMEPSMMERPPPEEEMPKRKMKKLKKTDINRLEKDIGPKKSVRGQVVEEPSPMQDEEEAEEQAPLYRPEEEEVGEPEDFTPEPMGGGEEVPELEVPAYEEPPEEHEEAPEDAPRPARVSSDDTEEPPELPGFDDEPAAGVKTKPDLGELEERLARAEEKKREEEKAREQEMKSKHKKHSNADDKHLKPVPGAIAEPAAKLTNAYKSRIRKRVRAEERADLMKEVEAEKEKLHELEKAFEKKLKAFEDQRLRAREDDEKLTQKEERIQQERERSLKIKEDVNAEREKLLKEKTEFKEIKPRLEKLRKEESDLQKSVEALKGKMALNEKLEKSLSQREAALKDAEKSLKVMEQNIRQEGFSKYLQTELAAQEIVYPKYSGNRDEMGVPGGDIYKIADECRAMLWQNKFDDAKLMYMKAREIYQQMLLRGETQGMDDVYNALRLLYDDINLAIIKG